MKRRIGLFALLALGCGASTPIERDVAPAPGPATLDVSEATPADGVTVMPSVCFEQERCDALDSDCDGHVDEGCPSVASGELEIGLAWNDDSSLTIALEPTSVELAGDDPEVDCGDAMQPRRARWSVPALAPGDYRIRVARTDACEAAEHTQASVAVAVRGRLAGTYNVTVGAEPADVVSFSVTEAR
ncbi:MAG: hypothetical protein H6719_30455 [Sandaracinaceae bacterium]|nr:hypothetical protein [Sandaracinaceae bacterium]